MRPNSDVRVSSRFIAAVLSGLLCTTSFAPWASAQAKPAAPAKPAPAAPAKAPPKPVAAPAAAPAPKMNEAQKRAAARKHYEDGKKKLEAKDFAGAITEFKAANEIIPSPQAEHKIALCHDEMGHAADAIAAYELFLSHAAPDKMQEQIDQAKARLAVLKGGAGVSVRIASDPPESSVEIDGVAQMGVTPLEAKLPPGKHTIKVSAPGYEPMQQEVEVKPGDKAPDVTFALTRKGAPPPAVLPPPPMPPPAAPAPPPGEEGAEKPRSNVPAYVTLGVAGAGVVLGTIFGVKALGDKKDFDDKPTAAKADDAERNALIADMAFGVAITLGVTGTVLLLSNKGAPEAAVVKTGAARTPPTMRLAPFAGPHGGGASAVWRF
jgi:hypothetical protein